MRMILDLLVSLYSRNDQLSRVKINMIIVPEIDLIFDGQIRRNAMNARRSDCGKKQWTAEESNVTIIRGL